MIYCYQRAPGWADPGRKKEKYASIYAGRKTIYQTIQGQRGWRWPLWIHALFLRTHPIFCLLNERSTVLLPPSQREGDREAVEGVS